MYLRSQSVFLTASCTVILNVCAVGALFDTVSLCLDVVSTRRSTFSGHMSILSTLETDGVRIEPEIGSLASTSKVSHLSIFEAIPSRVAGIRRYTFCRKSCNQAVGVLTAYTVLPPTVSPLGQHFHSSIIKSRIPS